MSAPVLGLVAVVALLTLLLSRMPVWLALVLCGIAGETILVSWRAASGIAGTTPFDVASSYSLSVVPLFILMGEVATSSRLSAELFRAARVFLSGIKGGLAIATIAASGAFGAVCGSSVATAATMTRIALPEMRKAGYEDSLSGASVAAGGSLGILIPPSIILVIYGSIAEQSVPRLFAASLVPGIALMVLYALVAVSIAILQPGRAPADPPASFKERLLGLAGSWQFMLLFIATIGGIYAGIFSPNEAAAVGAFGAILLGVAGGRMNFTILLKALRGTILTSSALFMIIIGANMFSAFVVQTRLPELLLGTAMSMELSPVMVMVLIIAIYIILGCFLEGIGMVLITVPVFLPVVVGLGYDPVWFGVIVVLVVELGLIHPPVGMNLFIIQAQAPEIKIGQLYIGVLPFLIAPFLLIAMLFVWPQISLWLPSVLY